MTYSLHPGAELGIADALDFYSEKAGLLVVGHRDTTLANRKRQQ